MAPSGTARSTPATARVAPNAFSRPVASMARGAPAVVMGTPRLRVSGRLSPEGSLSLLTETPPGTERRRPSFRATAASAPSVAGTAAGRPPTSPEEEPMSNETPNTPGLSETDLRGTTVDELRQKAQEQGI